MLVVMRPTRKYWINLGNGVLNFPPEFFDGVDKNGQFYLYIYRSFYMEDESGDYSTLIEFDNSVQLSLYRK